MSAPPTLPKTFGAKYIGSKNKLTADLLRTIIPLAPDATQHTLLDVFTGTTRVAQAFRANGWRVTTSDLAWASQDYAALFLQTTQDDLPSLRALAHELDTLEPGPEQSGWLETTYSNAAAPDGGSTIRVWQPHNAKKADLVRDTIADWLTTDRISVTMSRRLTALVILALDTVDNTVGVQQAYLKDWCTRSFNTLNLNSRIPPDDWPGWTGPPAAHVCGDALKIRFPLAHVAYIDPPYTTHSYATYYHIWDSIARWDKPTVLLKTNRRADRVAASADRDFSMVSTWNQRRHVVGAFCALISRLPVKWIVISYSSDALVPIVDIVTAAIAMDACVSCRVESVDHKRNVMANIGNGADSDNRSTVTEHLIVIEKA